MWSLPPKQEDTESPQPDTPSPLDVKRQRLRYKKQMLKEITTLEQYLIRYRQRLVTSLMMADKERDGHITVNELLSILAKLRVPVSQSAIELLITAVGMTEDGRIAYKMLLSGGLVKLVEAYFQKIDVEITVGSATECAESTHKSLSRTPTSDVSGEGGSDIHQKYAAPSTLGGETGKLADAYKQEELRQFNALITYCQEKGIVLTTDLAEKGKLQNTLIYI